MYKALTAKRNNRLAQRFHTEHLEKRSLFSAAVMDPSFGTAGLVNIGGSQQATNSVLQPDGKLLVVRETADYDNPGGDFVTERFNTDGSIDTGFGTQGIVTTSFTNYPSMASAVAVQPDRKIVVAGTVEFSINAGGMSMAVVRYNPDGSLDSTFGNGGISIVNGTGSTQGYCLTIQNGGQIDIGGSNESFIGGDVFNIPASVLTIAQLDPNGSLVSSFGTNGIASVYGAGNFAAEAIGTDGFNDIVVAGGPWIVGNTASLVRVTQQGVLDTTFGTNGVAVISPTSPAAKTLVIEPDGFYATAVHNGTTGSDSVYRFTSTGAPDSTFGTNGSATVVVSAAGTRYGSPQLALGVNDTLELGDNVGGDFNTTLVLLQFSENGALNPELGANGIFSEPGLSGYSYSIDLMSNGNVVQTTAVQIRRVIPSPASVNGIVYNDANENNVMDVGESGLPGWTIFADLNGTGVQTANDPTATTDANGQFTFAALPAETINFYLLPQPLYAVRSFQLTLIAGQVNQPKVPETTGNAIAGTVTLSGTSTPIPGTIVYVDSNNNGSLDIGEQQMTVGSDGTYRLGSLLAGTYTVREVLPSGDLQVTPANSAGQTVTLGAPGTGNKTGINFTAETSSTVTGTLFADLKGAGNPADFSPAYSQFGQVYFDANNNGVQDPGELVAAPNGNGQYLINNVTPGTYVVRQVPFVASPTNPVGWVQTVPANNAGVTVTVGGATAATFTFADFARRTAIGRFLVGTPTLSSPVPTGSTVQIAYTPLNSTTTTVANVMTDNSGYYSMQGYGPGTVTITPIAPPGYTPPSPVSVTVGSYALTQNYNFYITRGATLSGNVFADTNGDGTKNSGEVPLVGVTVFLDMLNSPGGSVLSTQQTVTDSAGSYQFIGLATGSYVIRQALPTGYAAGVSPVGGTYALSITAGSTITGNNFADKPIVVGPAPLTGTVIGTAGSYKNGGNTAAKAFDGNLATYFDGPGANGNWVGLDLGSAKIITSLAYTSRSGWASRMNGGIFQASNSATFASAVVNLYTIGSNANPSAASLTTQTISNTNSFRYVRYLAPANSYGDVAEIQFFGKAPVALTKFTGTTIGTSGSYGTSGNTIAKATDGNLSTFFDGPTANGNWVGLDLGSAKVIKQISYAPRSGFASRMIGGIFQVSNTANFSSGVVNLYTITAAPTPNVLSNVTINVTAGYRYVRYLAPNGSYGDIAEFQIFG